MNKITKKSFYSFLALYLISTFSFLALAAYWFFTSQVAMEKNSNFYKMNHIADTVSARVIKAQMSNTAFTLPRFAKADVAILDKNKELIYGGVMQKVDFDKEFYMKEGAFTLITNKTAGHLNAEYVIVQSSECISNIVVLKNKILYTVIMTAIAIIIIAIFLSYIFFKPIKDKMNEIEDFVKDTTHELNTPITALMMSTSRMKSKQTYDEKIVQNISISTKQLYEIYSSLSFLSFDNSSEKPEELYFDEVIKESLKYFGELLKKKKITLVSDLKPCKLNIAPTKAKMLINNLLSNAIKYSNPKTSISLTTTTNSFSIKDEGIGIAKDKLDEIFKRFVRASSYAGGFGVGLNIVDNIVKEYNYKLDIKSKETKGTEITIAFRSSD
ncbi:MAG: HAMP domain-containing sensor histidine kinase [Sulfurimonas sp.]